MTCEPLPPLDTAAEFALFQESKADFTHGCKLAGNFEMFTVIDAAAGHVSFRGSVSGLTQVVTACTKTTATRQTKAKSTKEKPVARDMAIFHPAGASNFWPVQGAESHSIRVRGEDG